MIFKLFVINKSGTPYPNLSRGPPGKIGLPGLRYIFKGSFRGAHLRFSCFSKKSVQLLPTFSCEHFLVLLSQLQTQQNLGLFIYFPGVILGEGGLLFVLEGIFRFQRKGACIWGDL